MSPRPRHRRRAWRTVLTMLTALGLVLALLPGGAAAAPERRPTPRHLGTVEILEPTDGAAVDTDTIDVRVAFDAADGGNISKIELLLDSTVVAAHSNPPGNKAGTHTFVAVDVSAHRAAGRGAVLVARGYQGATEAGLVTVSDPVRIAFDDLGAGLERLQGESSEPVDFAFDGGRLAIGDDHVTFRASDDPGQTYLVLDRVDVATAEVRVDGLYQSVLVGLADGRQLVVDHGVLPADELARALSCSPRRSRS